MVRHVTVGPFDAVDPWTISGRVMRTAPALHGNGTKTAVCLCMFTLPQFTHVVDQSTGSRLVLILSSTHSFPSRLDMAMEAGDQLRAPAVNSLVVQGRRALDNVSPSGGTEVPRDVHINMSKGGAVAFPSLLCVLQIRIGFRSGRNAT